MASVEDSGSESAAAESKDNGRVRIPSKHPSFYEMVTEAMLKLDNDRKGVSVQAIRSYITETYKTVDPSMLKFRMKVALAKGLDNGIFKRPKSSGDSKGATGRFRIDKAALEALNKPKHIRKSQKTDEKKTKPEPKVAKMKASKEKVSKEKVSKEKVSKEKVSKEKVSKEKSTLKSTKKSPAKSPTAKKKSVKNKSDSPKKIKTKKKLTDEEAPAKTKTKAKAESKITKTSKKKSTPKKKGGAKKGGDKE